MREKGICHYKSKQNGLAKWIPMFCIFIAYILRHWDIEKHGDNLYEVIPNKMKDGYVYLRGILNILLQYGFKVKYCTGNIAALKNEVSKGNPAIVMIRIQTDKNWLHYVPVVGYDEQYILIDKSLTYLVNSKEQYYNRKVSVKEFKKIMEYKYA